MMDKVRLVVRYPFETRYRAALTAIALISISFMLLGIQHDLAYLTMRVATLLYMFDGIKALHERQELAKTKRKKRARHRPS